MLSILEETWKAQGKSLCWNRKRTLKELRIERLVGIDGKYLEILK